MCGSEGLGVQNMCGCYVNADFSCATCSTKRIGDKILGGGQHISESEIHGFIVTDFCRYSNKHEQKGGFPTFWP